jgi:glycosyltransferase involved in cell wall biosynthesis
MNLVIAGDFDHDCSYNDKLRQIVARDARVVMTGYVIGEPLAQLFSNARLFVLPSHHEGLPIVLLEALSYGLPTLVSDIDPNREIGLFPHWYFKCGDIADLKSNLTNLLSYNITDMQRRCIRELLIEKFNWDTLSEQTLKVYEKALSSPD